MLSIIARGLPRPLKERLGGEEGISDCNWRESSGDKNEDEGARSLSSSLKMAFLKKKKYQSIASPVMCCDRREACEGSQSQY